MDFASIPTEAERLTKELVSIATSHELEDLRGDLVQRLVVTTFLNQPADQGLYLRMLAVAVISSMATVVEAFADEISGATA